MADIFGHGNAIFMKTWGERRKKKQGRAHAESVDHAETKMESLTQAV